MGLSYRCESRAAFRSSTVHNHVKSEAASALSRQGLPRVGHQFPASSDIIRRIWQIASQKAEGKARDRSKPRRVGIRAGL